MITTLLTNMPKLEEELAYAPPYATMLIMALLAIGAAMLVIAFLMIIFGDILNQKITTAISVEIVSMAICLFGALILYSYYKENAKHAFQDKQYSLIREKSTLTIQSESKYLETKNFQIIGEDESHLFLKRDNKLYEFHYKENIQQKD